MNNDEVSNPYGDQPSGGQPDGTQPASANSSDAQSSDAQSSDAQASSKKASESQPASAQPTASRADGNQSSSAQAHANQANSNYSPAGYASAPPPPPPAPVATAKPEKPGNFRRGFGTGLGFMVGAGIIGVVLTVITSLTLIGIASALAPNNDSAQDVSTTTVWGDRSASNTLRAFSITGTIMVEGGSSSSMFSSVTYGYQIAEMIDDLDADDAAGVLLLMDTPGGTITGSRAIADAVTRYQERTGHPVIAYVQGTSASGGMMAMAGADHIYSDYGTMIGSIGVIMGPFEYYDNVTATTGNILESGYEADSISQYYLTQGTAKDFGNPFREMADEERSHYGELLGGEYDEFVSWVSSSRDIPEDTIRNDFGAYMFNAQTARSNGLIDDVMNRDEAFRQAATDAGVDPDDTRVVENTEASALSQLLGARAGVYGHGEALQPGDGTTATSSLCTGTATVMAWSGDISAACGF